MPQYWTWDCLHGPPLHDTRLHPPSLGNLLCRPNWDTAPGWHWKNMSMVSNASFRVLLSCLQKPAFFKTFQPHFPHPTPLQWRKKNADPTCLVEQVLFLEQQQLPKRGKEEGSSCRCHQLAHHLYFPASCSVCEAYPVCWNTVSCPTWDQTVGPSRSIWTTAHRATAFHITSQLRTNWKCER